MTSSNPTHWWLQGHQLLLAGDYSQAVSLYEQAITAEPNNQSHYWHLGLILLLQGKEAEAQMTWFSVMTEGEPEEIDLWTEELIEVLETEAQRREALSNNSVAWIIRQHIREIKPIDINNLLYLILHSIQLKTFTGEELNSFGVIEILQSQEVIDLDFQLLMQVLGSVLDAEPLHPSSLELAEACIPYVQEPYGFTDILILNSVKIAYSAHKPELAARFLELALRLERINPEVLIQLTGFYQEAKEYLKGIETAKLCYSLFLELPEKVFANHLIIRGLMVAAGEYWSEAMEVFGRHESLLESLFKAEHTNLDPTTVVRLFSATYFLPYFRDDLKKNRRLQNQVAQICQSNIQRYASQKTVGQRDKIYNSTQPLKIGYLSHCLRRHSVGWLARWLFKYHDRERFQIYTYLINGKQRNDPLQEWYANQSDQAYKSGLEAVEITEQIIQDEIDILIDLDSITLDIICEITSVKPAPIQVTWLGWDASGIPNVDYFIADPYVLSESAQNYYSETIWRLPQTYIAVDGFEVGVPNLRREQLNIS
ncbi:MAG: O-linked N-acetylglucosamine transferase, SPINDLY family protein, partial [Phormidium sp.]